MDSNDLMILILPLIPATTLAAVFAFRKSTLWQILHILVIVPTAGVITFFGPRWGLSDKDFRELMVWSIIYVPLWVFKIEIGAVAGLLFGHAIASLLRADKKPPKG